MRLYPGCTLFLLSTLATACHSQEQELQKHSLREFIDIQVIQSVEAHNYSGHHWLTAVELQDFKKRFGAMDYLPGGSGQVKSVDMGNPVFVLHTHNRTYRLIGHPLHLYLGVPNELATQNRHGLAVEDQETEELLLFRFDRPINLNNYRKGPSVPNRP